MSCLFVSVGKKRKRRREKGRDEKGEDEVRKGAYNIHLGWGATSSSPLEPAFLPLFLSRRSAGGVTTVFLMPLPQLIWAPLGISLCLEGPDDY